MSRYRRGVWALRMPDNPRFTGGYVKMYDAKTLILAFPADPGHVFEVKVSRADARLYARRITQCLEASK